MDSYPPFLDSVKRTCRIKTNHFLAVTHLDYFTLKERFLIAGILAALLWGLLGVNLEPIGERSSPAVSGEGLYEQLLTALPDKDFAPQPAGKIREERKAVAGHAPRPGTPSPKQGAPEAVRTSAEGSPRPVTALRVQREGKISPVKINLNKATATELMEVPGIGPILAGRIIEYRNQHGSYASWRMLRKVKGIGEKRLEEFKEYLTLY